MDQIRAPARAELVELALDSEDVGLDVCRGDARRAVERQQLGARHRKDQPRARDAVGHRAADVRKADPVRLEKLGRAQPLRIDGRQRRDEGVALLEGLERLAEGDREAGRSRWLRRT